MCVYKQQWRARQRINDPSTDKCTRVDIIGCCAQSAFPYINIFVEKKKNDRLYKMKKKEKEKFFSLYYYFLVVMKRYRGKEEWKTRESRQMHTMCSGASLSQKEKKERKKKNTFIYIL